MTTITFKKESTFSIELKQKVQSIINADPRGRFADFNTWIKAIALMFICTSLYFSVIYLNLSFFERTLLVLTFSFFALILGLNVMHEAAHGNYSKKPFVNKLMAFSFDLFGISSDLYNVKHIHFHHNYTNIFGHDGDISEAPFLRMSLLQHWKPIHRFQKFYTIFLYSLITITWTLSDIERLISLKVGNRKFRRLSKTITTRIIFFKIVSLFLTYILPIQIFGWKQGLFFALLFHLSLGWILTLIFQVAHVHSEAQHNSSEVESDWLMHQLKTSADFGTKNKITCFLMGGLNFQVIHHLFPNVSYRHYPKIQTILKEVCFEHHLIYKEFNHFTDAVNAHFQWLDKMGKTSVEFSSPKSHVLLAKKWSD